METEKIAFEEPVMDVILFETVDVIDNSDPGQPGQGEWD